MLIQPSSQNFLPTKAIKRKRAPDSSVNEPFKPNRPSDETVIDRINIISFEKFQKLLEKTKPDSMRAIISLKRISTLIKDEKTKRAVYHRLWIEIPEGTLGDNRTIIWLDLTITKEEYEYHIDICEDGTEQKKLISVTYNQKNNDFSHDYFKGRQVSNDTSRQLSINITRFLFPEIESDVEFDSINVVTVKELYEKLNKSKSDYERRYQNFKKLCSPTQDKDGVVNYKLWIELDQNKWLQIFLEEKTNGDKNISIFDGEDESRTLATLKIDRENSGVVSYSDKSVSELITKIANHLTTHPKSGVEKQENTESINFDDFKTKLSKKTANFISAWRELIALCSPIDENTQYAQFRLSLTLSENNVFNLILLKGNYFSTSITEKELYPETTDNNSYYYLKIFQNSNFKQPILNMRFDVNGNAELIWLEKSNTLSGNEMKKLTYDLAKYFKVKKLFLHDDAKIKLKIAPPTFSTNLPVNALSYRKAMYLSTIKSLSSGTGDTWYTIDGFAPLKCRNLTLFNKSQQANQEPGLYFSAIEYLRKMKLIDLSCQIFPEYSHLISNMYKKYCSDIPFDQATFHDLIKLMHAKLIESQDEKREIVSEFATLYENFLEPTQRVKTNVEKAKWKLALEVINEHYIFVKDFESSEVENYEEFTTKAHTTYSELVKNFKLSDMDYSKLITCVRDLFRF